MAIKYLVINHPETADIKTVLAYDAPPSAPGAGYLNFNLADGGTGVDLNLGYNSSTVSLAFTYGGYANFIAPTITDFEDGNGNAFGSTQGYISNVSIQNNTMNNANSGSADIVFDIQSNTSTPRSFNCVYTGDISHPSQSAGENIMNVTQNGQQLTTGKTGKNNI
jgi:hypothetical protein